MSRIKDDKFLINEVNTYCVGGVWTMEYQFYNY